MGNRSSLLEFLTVKDRPKEGCAIYRTDVALSAQRLVRRVCKYCKIKEPPDMEIVNLLRIPPESIDDQVVRGKGCPRCNNTGYLGRLGIYELFLMNDDFRHVISENCKGPELLNLAKANGMKYLLDDGLAKVKQGETTLSELLRVLGPQIRHERVCVKCQKTIEGKFLFCPYCGKFREDICKKCKMPLENDWNVCAACGTNRTNEPRQLDEKAPSPKLP